MSDQMTKLRTRNAKDTIIELVIIVRIVMTHKLLQFEDVNPVVTLCPSRASRDNWRRKGFPEQPFQYQAYLYESTSQIHSYANYTSRSSACWNRLLAPLCAHAQNECHVISSPDIDLHILVTNSRSMQDHIAKFTQQNAHTEECIS